MNNYNNIPNPYQVPKNAVLFTILVAALGYFVDIYDLLLFSIVRTKSLQDLGIIGVDVTNIGLSLLNYQMMGMLLGGLIWGVLGDRRGRLSVLFGSIILYSLANIANGFVDNIFQYKMLRLIAGIGLAGELGAGITLVSEVMSKEKRGYGTTIVAAVGLMGAVAAYGISELVHWRTAYFIGGGMGLLLLLLRISIFESGMYKNLSDAKVVRGNFFMLFKQKKRFIKYCCCILIGLPTWFVVGILVTLTPEFAKYFGMQNPPLSAGQAVMWCYIGLALGDLVSGTLSQTIKSRKKTMLIFHLISVLGVAWFLSSNSTLSNVLLQVKCLFLGFGVGYWAVFVTIASEQFGTNIRATVTTTVPNFARGALVPISQSFKYLKESSSIIEAAIIVGLTCVIIALIALYFIPETFGKNLDYLEE